MNPNWELKNCCQHEQVVFLATIGIFTVVILALWRTFLLTPFKLITVFLHEASHAIACKLTCGEISVHHFGVWLSYLHLQIFTSRIAAGCLILSLLIVLFIAKNWTLRGLCIGFIIFIAVVWVLQETTKARILRYLILFIGVMNSLFSVYDIYDDLISRRVHSSDAEKFAELCPCPCNGVGWGVIWGMISFIFLCAAIYLGLVILS
ncbi:hypothetical protein Sango_1831900 [Sesamum angolense]|uniref:Peptidase M50B-like protein n=1 Tax=Sesamum angolense TaxID=2727404 RepID=A0AAE1WHT9_9LAMI|nr:hypothetical protein Sango_1831900 [Sesamum angolense]